MLKPLYTIFFLAFLITHTAHGQEAFFDPAFGVGGKVVVPLGATENGSFEDVAIQPDGKIVAVGFMVGKAVVARFKENGTLDTSFGVNGFFIGSPYSSLYDVVIQSDNKIIAIGQSMGTNMEFFSIRLNSDGTPDFSFGISGIVNTDLVALTNDNGRAVALQTDGKIVVGGNASVNTGITRLLANGTLDNSFDTDGIATYVYGSISGIESTFGDRITASGIYKPGDEFLAMRTLANGQLDTTFNHVGFAHVLAGNTWNYCEAMSIQSDGKILLAGSGTFGTQGSDFTVVRYNIDGSLDGSFGSGGIVHVDFNYGYDRGWAMTLTTDGKILVAGPVTMSDNLEDFGIARLNTDGSIDNTFGTGGKIVTSIRFHNDQAHGMALQADGKIMLAGHSVRDFFPNNYSEPVVARYKLTATTFNQFETKQKKTIFYPNPAMGYIYISPSVAAKAIAVYIYDVLGRDITDKIAWNNDRIDIIAHIEGRYILKIVSADGTYYWEQVLINK